MGDVRDRNDILHPQAIEAIKMNQDIIKRLAENAQKIKTYFLSMCALCTVLAKDIPAHAIVLFTAITLVFWYMDARYLRLERQFREHHKAIVNGSIPRLDYLSFNPGRYVVPSILSTMFSFSELIYPSILVLLFVFLA